MTISDKIRIYELSRDLNLDNKDILDAAQKLSISVKSHSSSISTEDAKKIKNLINKKNTDKKILSINKPSIKKDNHKQNKEDKSPLISSKKGDAIKDLKNKYSNPNSAIELNAVNNSFSLELKSSLNEFVDDLLPSDLKTSELRTLATIAIKKKILQSDLILLRGSGAYDHIKELLEKKFIVKRKQKDGRSYWLSLSEKFFQTFAVSNEYLSNIGSGKNKQQ